MYGSLASCISNINCHNFWQVIHDKGNIYSSYSILNPSHIIRVRKSTLIICIAISLLSFIELYYLLRPNPRIVYSPQLKSMERIQNSSNNFVIKPVQEEF